MKNLLKNKKILITLISLISIILISTATYFVLRNNNIEEETEEVVADVETEVVIEYNNRIESVSINIVSNKEIEKIERLILNEQEELDTEMQVEYDLIVDGRFAFSQDKKRLMTVLPYDFDELFIITFLDGETYEIQIVTDKTEEEEIEVPGEENDNNGTGNNTNSNTTANNNTNNSNNRPNNNNTSGNNNSSVGNNTVTTPTPPVVDNTPPTTQPPQPTPELPPQPVRCTNNNNHGAIVGNVGKWGGRQQLINEHWALIQTWEDKVQSGEITVEEYRRAIQNLGGAGYEIWSCMFCGLWTLNRV